MSGGARGVVVTGVGLATACGGAAQSAAAARAGLAQFAEHAFFLPETRDPGWEDDIPLLCAAVPELDPFLPGPARLIALAALAVNDLVSAARVRRRDLADATLLVALPEDDDAVRPWALAEFFVADLVRHAGLPAFRAARVAHRGHAGVLELLAYCASLFEERAAERCLVLGVDSYLCQERFSLLDAARRIKSARNVDGFIPGEAAAALLVEPAASAAARGAEPLATVAAVRAGAEPRTVASDRQSSGAGLCAALRALLEGSGASGGEPPAWVLCDLNGESYRSFEWGAAVARLGAPLGGVKELWHPADCFGDIGAATGGALLACAAAAFRRGYAPAGEAIVITGSDAGQRVAARVTRPASA